MSIHIALCRRRNPGLAQQGVYLVDNLNLAGNLANSAMATAAGNAQKPIEGNASGTTKSAIAAGTVTITDGASKAGELAKDPKYAGLTQDEIYYAIRSVYRNDQVGTGDLKSFDSEAAAKSAGVPASYDPTTGKWLGDPVDI